MTALLQDIELENILFLDIETVSATEKFEEISEVMQELWISKSKQRYPSSEKSPSELYRHAAIFAEFGKIICISCGYFHGKPDSYEFRIKSFYNTEEKELLHSFAELLNKHFNSNKHRLCAHNGKEFDFPFMARRMLINGVTLPNILNTPGKKPWEVNHIDTLELWKFGDFKNYTSLKLLTNIFGIPTPKDDIDGSMIYDVYYEENNLDRIVKYCQKDVIAVARLFQKLNGQDFLKDESVRYL